jgi:lipopolysaccharide/colanic/teichoic acid biosynthesis glycosyltransferase
MLIGSLELEQESFYARFAKRWLDVVFASVALVVCLPILILTSILIIFESPGSPIFRQKRIGQGGREFNMYKLRSMQLGSEIGSFLTLENDTRLTRTGRFFRRTKLDELPQLWNVLTGDMSLIGPRPLSTIETEFLESNLDFDSHYPGFQPNAKPGLTGLEQVRRNRKMHYCERFALNDSYESNLTFQQDFQILLQTICLCRTVTITAAIGGLVELLCFCSITLSSIILP